MNSDAIAGTTSQWDCCGSMAPENGRKNAEVTHFHCAAHLEASFMRLNFSATRVSTLATFGSRLRSFDCAFGTSEI